LSAGPESGRAAPESGSGAPGSLLGGRQKPRTSRRRLSFTRLLAYRVAAPIAAFVLRALWATLRVRFVPGPAEEAIAIDPSRPTVPCFWHGELFVDVLYLFELRRLGLKIGWLISPSVDGELAALISRQFGVHVVRGSSTRSGVKALRDLHRAVVREGVSPVMLPDGPKGPPRTVKPGCVVLAQLSGATVLPIACRARRALRLPTWDRMLIPLPFSRVVVAVGRQREVPRDLAGPALAAACRELEAGLEELGQTAAEVAGG